MRYYLRIPIFLLLVFSSFFISSCSDSEEPLAEEEVIDLKYYVQFTYRGEEYLAGFNEHGDQFNPREIINGQLTNNFILYNSGIFWASFTQFCDTETKPCLGLVMEFQGNTPGTFSVTKFEKLSTKDYLLSNRWIGSQYTPEPSVGGMQVVITKVDATNRVIEGTFKGSVYEQFTEPPKLEPLEGSFRAMYN